MTVATTQLAPLHSWLRPRDDGKVELTGCVVLTCQTINDAQAVVLNGIDQLIEEFLVNLNLPPSKYLQATCTRGQVRVISHSLVVWPKRSQTLMTYEHGMTTLPPPAAEQLLLTVIAEWSGP